MRKAPPVIATEALISRFWSKARVRSSFEECWLWQACLRVGYGSFKYRGYVFGAHRMSWMLSRDRTEVPPKCDVCHRCDVRSCVNPNHLFLGSRRDNMLDASRKGRLGKLYGVRIWNARLNDDAVRRIRAMRRETGWGHRRISRALNLPLKAVRGVLYSGRWKHVEA